MWFYISMDDVHGLARRSIVSLPHPACCLCRLDSWSHGTLELKEGSLEVLGLSMQLWWYRVGPSCISSMIFNAKLSDVLLNIISHKGVIQSQMRVCYPQRNLLKKTHVTWVEWGIIKPETKHTIHSKNLYKAELLIRINTFLIFQTILY